MSVVKSIAASLAFLSFAGIANAASLTGDEVTLSMSDLSFSDSQTVGAGPEFASGAVTWDLDSGPDGDQFEVVVDDDFFLFGASSFEFSSLDFSGGEILVGIGSLVSQFANTSVSVTDDSVLFTFLDGPVTEGIVMSGTFLTKPADAAVPLPAGAPLILSALAMMGLVGRRRRA